MENVLLVIGPGSMGTAIARRIGAGMHVVVADLREPTAKAAEEVLLDAGFRLRRGPSGLLG